MNIIDDILAESVKHATWRRDIHAHPELAYNEHRTSDFIAEKMSEFGIPIVRGLGETGVVGTIERGNGGGAIGLRADMDALPLQELNEFEHRSHNDGVMHGCGHDGHVVMLLAAAEHLAKDGDFNGTVHLIFQPAEEGEAGAQAMIDDGLFERFKMDGVYGLHNWPGVALGRMAMRVGPMLASADIFEARIIGKGGHGAMPHQGVDPIIAATQIVQAWNGIVSRNLDALDAGVISTTQIHAGDAWAVIPDEVVLRGTTRSFKPEVQALIETRMREVAEGIAQAGRCTCQWHYEKRFPPTVNSERETEHAARAAVAVVGADNVDRNPTPTMGAEDFAYMLQVMPGCYSVIGNGPGEGDCMLHSPRYDFNDDLIPIGASYWVTLVNQLLAK
jgi:hippurate hydrolase